MPRKVGTGIYKRIKGVNVHNENHPWRKMILADVIQARNRPKNYWANELKRILKDEKI